MRVVLFDVLLERHLTDSLARAFARAGHDVVVTGPVWTGHRFPEGGARDTVAMRLEEALGDGADLLFCFRPSTLPPDLVRSVSARGVHTMTWFSDDPVLFEHITRHLVDPYDTVLHCGGPRILAFYESAFGRPTGVNMPFWADPEEFPFLHDPAIADLDVAFLGSTRGDVRRHRYDVLAGLDASVRIYGRVDQDPGGIYGGFLDGTEETVLALRRARLALSIPQHFREYAGSRYDFPELGSLGSFDMPSRIAQCAVMGLPVVSLDDGPPIGFPEVVAVSDELELPAIVEALLGSDLVEAGRSVHRRARTRFSADARVALIEHLVDDPTSWRKLDPGERSGYFCAFDRDEAVTSPPTPVRVGEVVPELDSLPTLEAQRAELAATRIDSPHPWRILFIGTFTFGPTDVVACALRGLRNLGHRVLHLDPERHAGLVRPAAPRGGEGPNWVDVDWLEPILDRFVPQVVVCAAGGLCLTSEEAQRLTDRGVLLVGVTLSDPDVFESMVDHVGRFDLHATNSREALGRYERAGLGNTTLFPFAIDRAFAAATLVDDASLRADVICIGGGRPDRREVMNRLDERFDVRVYGKGWDDPATEVVAGRRLIQAARAGRIHVNFARTRAGFTNVKCGVFESVAAGGVLCTARFAEMGDLFDYGTEIVGWDHVEDLEVKIAGLLADPDRLERYRRRSFARLAADHLYEHRWLDLFAPVLRQLEGGPGPLPADRLDHLRAPLSSAEEPVRPVLLAGYYGAGNAGDDLILESITEGARRAEPSLEFHVASRRPAAVERQGAIQGHEQRDVGLLDAIVRDSVGVVVGGGGLWHDYTFDAAGGLAGLFDTDTRSVTGTARSLLLAALHGVPAHVYSMGVGPLTDPQAQAFLAWLRPQLASVSVRDEGSAALLESIEGWPGPVPVVPDPVYALALPDDRRAIGSPAAGRRRLGVSLRPWPAGEGRDRRSDLTSALAAVLDRYPELDLVGIPLQPRVDIPELEAVLGELAPDRTRVLTGAEATPSQVISALAGCDGVVAMRLHACLLSHRLGVPVVGLAYDPKLRHHFAQLGADRNLLPLEVDRGRLATALIGLIEEPSRVDRDRVRALERRAEAGVAALAALLAASDRPVMYDVPPEPPEALRPQRGDASVVDLSEGRLVLDDPAPDPAIAAVELTADQATLSYAIGAPQPGQSIGLGFRLGATPGEACAVSCVVTSPYARRRNTKWIAYQVVLDGTPVVEEDIALWGRPNRIEIELVPDRPSIDLTIRLVPLKPCKDWSWQRPSRIVVESVRVSALAEGGETRVGASSPHASVVGPAEVASGPTGPLSGLARIGRGLDRRLGRLRNRVAAESD